MNILAGLGMLLGIVIALLLAAIIWLMFKKGGMNDFDERQKSLRYRAYASAFWVLVAYVLINGVSEMIGYKWAEAIVSGFVGVCISCMVFVIQCIIGDAYFAINRRPMVSMALFALLCVMNLMIFLGHVASGESFFTDGLLNFRIINLLCVGMLSILFVAVGIKAICTKRRGEDG